MSNHQPVIVSRSEHNISRQDISEYALKVLYRLKKAGHAAFLVGGSVRDLLLGGHPKDFDVATDATPEEVKALFRNCRLIGRRFRLAHVFFGREIIEVATFRAPHDQAESTGEGMSEGGLILRDNVFGTLEEDAWRRDFTVNALYYNIDDFSVVDYTHGLVDLEQRVLRMIGDPEVRIQEDPVRMLRAVRFAAKLGFSIDTGLEELIRQHAGLLDATAPARLFDEVLKLFMHGHAVASYEVMCRYDILRHMFAQTAECLDSYADSFIRQALQNTDQRIREDKPVTPAFLYAALLWPAVKKLADMLQGDGMSMLQALQQAGQQVTDEQLQQILIPKRFGIPMREIWCMQARLLSRRGKRPLRLLDNPRFRAAYDFLLLRQQAGENLAELAEWWTRFQHADDGTRMEMTRARHQQGNSKKRKRRKPRQKAEQ